MTTVRAQGPRKSILRGNGRALRSRALTFEALESRLPLTVPPLEAEVVVELSAPVVATHAGDERIFVAELGGQIRIVDNGTVLPTPFLDISSLVVTGGERGLLGLAFHPDYAVNGADGEGHFYIYYSASATMGGNHDSVVAEYSVSTNDPNQADAESERVVLRFNQPFANHNGGDLKFGPDDDLLYISSGDGGGGGDPQNNGQNLNTVLGKILRIDVDGGDSFPSDPNRNLVIPPSNPFANDPNARGEIFAYGLRNPYRMSFDDGPDGAASPDRLFVGDVGQNLFEEVDIVTSGGNYGWDICEANHVLGNASQPCPPGFINPISEYDHSVGVSVIGGFVYRGERFPQLNGVYLFGDLNGTPMALEQQGGNFVRSRLIITGVVPDSIIGFGEDQAGELYVLTFSQMLAFNQIATVDFGDAPASYAVTNADNGAVHGATGPRLGSLRDTEADGLPTAGANGDDVNVSDDEDGVAFNSPLVVGQPSTVNVVTSAAGNLNAWIDFNRDGHFDDAGEQILTDRAVVGGSNNLPFNVSPAALVGASAYARFRLTSSTSVAFDGLGADGEVEDHQVAILTESDKIGVHRGNQFFLDVSANGSWGAGDRAHTFGNTTDTALAGDWNGDGRDEIGIRRGGTYYLDRNGNGVWNGVAGGDVSFTFRGASGVAFRGDWNGNGFDDIGVQEGNKFYLDFNGNGMWDDVNGGDRLLAFGNPGDSPLAGDWNGDGRDDIGVQRGNAYYLDVNGNGIWNGVMGGDVVHVLGMAGDRSLVGDWNADGRDNIGYQRGNVFVLDVNGNGQDDGVAGGDQRYVFGNSGDLPLIGKWRPNGALMAAGGAASVPSDAAPLTRAALTPILQQAFVIWANTSLNSSQLQTLPSVRVEVADLPGAQLGLSLGGTILLDVDAAGYGWFVDPTPDDNSEFSNSLIPSPQSLDLLSAVLHELGHELGFDHNGDLTAMLETLAIGTRRLP